MDKFNLSVNKKYEPRQPREITCIICNNKFKTKAKSGCCSKNCKLIRKRLLEQEYRKSHKREFAEWAREYAHNNTDKINAKAKRCYLRNKEIALIRAETRNSNEKTGICNDCKNIIKTEFHHESYKPNIFVELCKGCHIKRHGGILHVK